MSNEEEGDKTETVRLILNNRVKLTRGAELTT